MRIKDWHDFQHFKDRTPPWIKLYRYLLDDPEWHSLSGDDAKTLVMLWLIASEHKDMKGDLPNVKTLAFRLRTTETKLNQSLTKLSHWLIQDDDSMISDCHQGDTPEERQRQRQRQSRDIWRAPINKSLLDDYLKVRKAKRAGDFTETAFNAIEKEALKVGLSVEQAIEYCCKRSWVGFESSWYLKDNPNPAKSNKVVL
jgi:hypothetical protein